MPPRLKPYIFLDELVVPWPLRRGHHALLIDMGEDWRRQYDEERRQEEREALEKRVPAGEPICKFLDVVELVKPLEAATNLSAKNDVTLLPGVTGTVLDIYRVEHGENGYGIDITLIIDLPSGESHVYFYEIVNVSFIKLVCSYPE